VCNCEIIGVCGDVCEQPLEEKREREKDKHNLQVLPIATYVGYFENPIVKPCLIWLQFLLKISYSYLFNLDSEIVFWKSVEASGLFVKSCCPQKFPITVSLDCFKNPTVKYSPMALKCLLEFYHSYYIVLDGRI